MPWVRADMCTGCGVCVADCPVDAIALTDEGAARIDEVACIRCGRCHDVCPQDAVRHDSERIPQEIAEKLRWVRTLLGHFPDRQEQVDFLDRMERFFKKEQKVSERTLAAIQGARANPAEGLDAALHKLDAKS